jgi:hypothetical protein
MPSRVWSHLCDYAAIDGSGKPLIIGDFDNINAPNLPIQLPLFFVISKWVGYGGETFTHQIRIISPSGREISSSTQVDITIQPGPNDDGNHLNLDSFMMLQFDEFGEYVIEIVLDGNTVHILPLMVNQQ